MGGPGRRCQAARKQLSERGGRGAGSSRDCGDPVAAQWTLSTRSCFTHALSCLFRRVSTSQHRRRV
ncbi:hypothetical protein INR49_001936 [Caranx melampygus]|nr:hypothetical protein INR49_001936 [Caranx melampygus]